MTAAGDRRAAGAVCRGAVRGMVGVVMGFFDQQDDELYSLGPLLILGNKQDQLCQLIAFIFGKGWGYSEFNL